MYIVIMDKFVTVKKPTTVRLNGKQDATADKTERQKFRFSPYSVTRSNERKFESWKDRKRTEKSFNHPNVNPFAEISPTRAVQDSRPIEDGPSLCPTETIFICPHEASPEYTQGRVKPYHPLEHL